MSNIDSIRYKLILTTVLKQRVLGLFLELYCSYGLQRHTSI